MEKHTRFAELGFGCMRLPTRECGGREVVDADRFAEMVDLFMGAGFSYFDTARTYHGGLGEGALKRALIDRYPRDDFRVASKLPAYLAESGAIAEQMFYVSLEDTQAGYFDRYLLHNLGGTRTEKYDEYDLWDFLEDRRRDGLVNEAGFSFHGFPDELDRLLEAHPFVDFVQLQINFLDWDDETVRSRENYEVARAHGKKVMVMEPLKGGLACACADACDTPAVIDAALRFAASLEGVDIVLSGMSSAGQVRDNVATFGRGKPLGESDAALLGEVAHALRTARSIPCTGCRYCLAACPQHIQIPQAIAALNLEGSFHDRKAAAERYLWTSGGPASSCIACGLCERVCPQALPIPKLMSQAASRFEQNA